MLEVRIRKVDLAIPYAYNAFRYGAGFLTDDFPYARMKIVPLDAKRMVGLFAPGIEVPLAPFFGSMGGAATGVRPLRQRAADDQRRQHDRLPRRGKRHDARRCLHADQCRRRCRDHRARRSQQGCPRRSAQGGVHEALAPTAYACPLGRRVCRSGKKPMAVRRQRRPRSARCRSARRRDPRRA